MLPTCAPIITRGARGKKGKTPVVETTGARYRMSLISAINSRGHMRFMIKEKGGVNAVVFIEFLKRMMTGVKRTMNSFGNTLRPTLLAAWRSPTRMISKPRFAHPCVNCRTTRKKSDHSTKSHPSNTPRESVLTYGWINNLLT